MVRAMGASPTARRKESYLSGLFGHWHCWGGQQRDRAYCVGVGDFAVYYSPVEPARPVAARVDRDVGSGWARLCDVVTPRRGGPHPAYRRHGGRRSPGGGAPNFSAPAPALCTLPVDATPTGRRGGWQPRSPPSPSRACPRLPAHRLRRGRISEGCAHACRRLCHAPRVHLSCGGAAVHGGAGGGADASDGPHPPRRGGAGGPPGGSRGAGMSFFLPWRVPPLQGLGGRKDLRRHAWPSTPTWT